MNLFITKNGNRLGPYSIEEAQRLRATGQLQDSDLAWYEGLTDWIPLIQVPGFASSIARPPLPYPGAPQPQNDPALLIKRVVTALVLFFILFVGLFAVIFMVVLIIGGAVSGAEAAAAAHAQGYEEGAKFGREAGHKFAETYSGLVAGIDALVSLVLAAGLAWLMAFSNLFPWCRRN